MKNQFFDYRDKCPACYSEDFFKFYEKPFSKPPISDYLESFYKAQGSVEFEYLNNVNYVLSKCQNCSLIFQNFVPNAFLSKRLYDKWIDPNKVFNLRKRRNNFERIIYYTQEISTIIGFLKKKPSNLNVFDFGMGWGDWCLIAKGFGCNSYGSELSEHRIDFAKKNGVNVLSWDEIPNYRFDFINTEQVFEHTPNPLEILIYIKNSLKSNGILKISVPTARNIENRLRIMDWQAKKGTKNSLNPVAPLEHINYYKRSSLLKMAEKAGLEEITLPIKLQYQYKTKWLGPKNFAKNLLAPIQLNIFKTRNYLFFKKKH